jgi:excisionase family DNA binding protein
MGKKAYIKQAASELGLTEYQLRRMAKEGKLPFLKSGVKYIFDIELCEEFLRKQAIENINRVNDDTVEYGTLRKIKAI